MDNLHTIILEDAQKIITKVKMDELNGRSILITGASGLIGTYLLASIFEHVRSKGITVNVTAVTHGEIPEHLNKFLDGVKVVRGDITDKLFINSLPSADFIIHAAGYGQPGKFMEDKVKTIAINTSATMWLFEKLLPNGKFLFLSTSEVYSGLNSPPFKEEQIGTTNTIHPRACYIEGKRTGEAICNAYRSKGVAAKSARLSLAYGPGTKIGDARVLNNFIGKALMQGKIELLDMGRANRTYCYVADAVEILWHILFFGEAPVYNVGGISRTTIGDLARQIGGILGVPVVFPTSEEAAKAGAPDDVYLDMSLVAKEFKKNDYITLADGLSRTINWQRSLYETSGHRG
jgi:nucleoside-diphosphate-sugar epimerase